MKATHVVVGVTYGAEAYCVLIQDINTTLDCKETREEAKKNLSNWGSKLLNALEEKQSVRDFQKGFSKKERKSLTWIKCRFYADLQTQVVRECSIIDAYKHCIKLIEEIQIADDENHAVPISVVLCSLKNLIGDKTKAAQIALQYRDVNSELVSRCYRSLAILERISSQAKTFRSAVNKNSLTAMSQFVQAIDSYQIVLKEELKRAVIKLRDIKNGEDGDKELEKIANAAEKHQLFQPNRLELWLEHKKAESEILKKIMHAKEITLFDSLKQLTNDLVNSDKKYALVLSVASLDEWTKSIIAKMKNWMKGDRKLEQGDLDEEGGEVKNGAPWHTDAHKRKQVLDKIQELTKHAKKNQHLKEKVQFLMVICDVGNRLCRYSVYESGVLKENIGQLPRPPTGLQIKAKTSVSVHVKWDHEELGYPFQYKVEYRLKNDDNWKQQKTYPSELQMTISLKEGADMEIRVATDTCIGCSEFSETVGTETDSQSIVNQDSDDACEEIPKSVVRKYQQPRTDRKNSVVEAKPTRSTKKDNLVSLEKSREIISNPNFLKIDRNDCIEMAALGRRFDIGHLYDYRNDRFTGNMEIKFYY